MGDLRHDKSFDWLRNLPAKLKCVVFVTTSPGLPYVRIFVNMADSHLAAKIRKFVFSWDKNFRSYEFRIIRMEISQGFVWFATGTITHFCCWCFCRLSSAHVFWRWMKKNNTNYANKLVICQCGCDTWHNETEPLRTIQGHKITGITQAEHFIGRKETESWVDSQWNVKVYSCTD